MLQILHPVGLGMASASKASIVHLGTYEKFGRDFFFGLFRGVAGPGEGEEGIVPVDEHLNLARGPSCGLSPTIALAFLLLLTRGVWTKRSGE